MVSLVPFIFDFAILVKIKQIFYCEFVNKLIMTFVKQSGYNFFDLNLKVQLKQKFAIRIKQDIYFINATTSVHN